MILTKPQAKACYDAMCVLNNVNGRLIAELDRVDTGTYKRVAELLFGQN